MADPGFSRGGAPTPKSAIIFQIFCRKLHNNERIWTPGARFPGAPLGSANDKYFYTQTGGKISEQWQIQDFPEVGVSTLWGAGDNIRFCQIFPQKTA